MNKIYRDLTLARVQAAVGAAKAVTGVGHQGLKGQLREIVIRDLLCPLFPSDFGIGTGTIISHNDLQSRQQDVVIFDRSIVPPILLEGSTGFFPIESVIATIEIKSKLTAGEVASSLESAKHLRSLPFLAGEYDANGQPINRILLPAITTILAFSTDLSETGKTEIERFEEIRKKTQEEPHIQMVCVVGRGCWTWTQGKWTTWEPSYPQEELITFIAVLMNSYRNIGPSRKEPRIGMYLF
jgi:hypothetical protein